MPNLVLHEQTAAQLKQIASNPPHALLITGPSGIGKSALAAHLAADILHVDELDSYPYAQQISSLGSKQIGIETIRELDHFLSLKIPGVQAINRLVLIHDAQKLGVEAQNALLKTLEEPPQGTMLILTSSSANALLPTIRSRTQTLDIIKPNTSQLAIALETNGLTATDTKQILALSDGLPGLAFALAAGDQDHPLVAAAQTARHLLQQPLFIKLAQVDKLAKDSQASLDVLRMLLHMSRAALLTGKTTERWQKVMAASYAAQTSLQQGAQTKLVLTNFMLNL